MQNLVRDKCEISALLVRDKCVTNRVEYFVFALTFMTGKKQQRHLCRCSMRL